MAQRNKTSSAKIKSPSIKACRTEEDYLREFNHHPQSGMTHTWFYHYTKVDNANKILLGEKLRLTLLHKTSNDTLEGMWYGSNGNYLFSVCFATGTSENLPLWYLYSGIDGKGVRLGFSKKQIAELLRKPVLELVKTAAAYPYEEISKPIPLQDNDYRWHIKDVLYIGTDSQNPGSYRIKHNGRTNNHVSEAVIKGLTGKYGAFCKGLIWFYEKETRLQVEIVNPKLKEWIKKNDFNCVVNLSLGSLKQAFSVAMGPAFKAEEKTELAGKDGFQKYLLAKLEDSAYTGQINMNLQGKQCETCKDKKCQKKESTK